VAGTVEDATLVGRLRDGEERGFEETVAAFYPAMFAVARGYVGVRGMAEEVVQEAWLAVLNGLDHFEGRSSLRTWVLQIAANIARNKAAREARSLPFFRIRRRGPGAPRRLGPVPRCG
jgi:RNA polymerase sigma-70 factor (ECF subfamily)